MLPISGGRWSVGRAIQSEGMLHALRLHTRIIEETRKCNRARHAAHVFSLLVTLTACCLTIRSCGGTLGKQLPSSTRIFLAYITYLRLSTTGRRPVHQPYPFNLPRVDSKPKRTALRTTMKATASRFNQLPGGHALVAPLLKDKWKLADFDECWWCEKGRQS